MILVDSSVWIDYFRGAESRAVDALDRLLGSEPLATGDLIDQDRSAAPHVEPEIGRPQSSVLR